LIYPTRVMMQADISSALAELVHAFGKSRVAFVATGAAALEVALTGLKIGQGDKVLVPLESCYLVAASVIRVRACPIFVDVGRQLVLTSEDLENVNGKARALIAVHAFGLPCNVAALREYLGTKVAIIEDASLAFGIRQAECGPGTNSDIVVSSLGDGKPISIGEGGMLLSDDVEFSAILDRRSAQSRLRPSPPLPYALSPLALAALPAAISTAKSELAQRRNTVAWAIRVLQSLGFETWSMAKGDLPCWHRLPIWGSKQLKRLALAANKKVAVDVAQLPHRISVADLPMFRGQSIRAGRGDRRETDRLMLLRMSPASLVVRWLDEVCSSLERLGGI
jgi:dTDP-4-amino-4,6-dideoxygalactose transaminase